MTVDREPSTEARRIGTMRRPPEERFWKLVAAPDANGCLTWMGNRDRNGYGALALQGGRSCRAHRFGYELAKGPIPLGLVIDHLCEQRSCVNADHLEAVTVTENNRRTLERHPRSSRTTCFYGHPLDGMKRSLARHYRYCKTCKRAVNARQKARRLAMAAA